MRGAPPKLAANVQSQRSYQRTRFTSWRGARHASVLLAAVAIGASGLCATALLPSATLPASAAQTEEAVECAVPAADAASPAARTSDRAETGTPPPNVFVIRPGSVASPTPAANAAAPLADELTAVARALAACLSDGEAETVALLATENYLGQLYGGGEPLAREDYLALADQLDAVATEIRAVRDVEQESDGRASAEVVSVVGRQLLQSRWEFVQIPADERVDGETGWQVDAEALEADVAPADAEELEVALEDYAIGVAEETVEGPVVTLQGRNAGAEDHEMLVLRFEDEMTATDLLRQPGPGLPGGVTYIGQATVPAGEEAEMTLVDLEPGSYTIVCLLPTPRGTPHLALGMAADFTVE